MMNVTHNEASRRLIRRALGQCHALCHWPALALDVLAGACQLGRYRKNQPILAGNRMCRDVLVLASGSVEVGGVNAAGVRFVLSLHGAGDIIIFFIIFSFLLRIYMHQSHTYFTLNKKYSFFK